MWFYTNRSSIDTKTGVLIKLSDRSPTIKGNGGRFEEILDLEIVNLIESTLIRSSSLYASRAFHLFTRGS